MLKTQSQLLVLFLLVGLSLACNLDKIINGEAEKANKLIDKANVAVEKSNKLTIQSNELLNKLIDDYEQAEDVKKYQVENKSKFEKLTKLNEESFELHNVAHGNFEKAARLDIDEKDKEYLNYKVQEFLKTIAIDNLYISFVEDFVKTQDIEKLNEISANFTKKVDKLNEEIKELQTKSDQIKKENPDIWKN